MSVWFLALALAAEPPDPAQALRDGQVNVDHYYNLGLEMEAQEQPALAVLSYQRGLMLAPHDAQVQERLAALRALPEDGPALAPKVSGWLAVLAWACALLLLAAWRLRSQPSLAFVAAPVLLLAGGLGALTQSTLSTWGQRGLVLDTAVVTSQAGEGGQALFELTALEQVEILAQGEGALQIRTEDGRVGWMSEPLLGVLDPRAEPPTPR